jgi:hypothetical protein
MFMMDATHIDFLERETDKRAVADIRDIKDLLDSFVRLYEIKRRIERYNINIDESAEHIKNQIVHQKRHFLNTSSHDNLLDSIDNLQQSISNYQVKLKEHKKYIENRIREFEIIFLQKDYLEFEFHLRSTAEDLIERRSELSSNVKDYLLTLGQESSGWQLSAADINPTDGGFTSSLVANEPLYIVGKQELLDYTTKSITEKHNAFYAERRVRKYLDLNDLPNNGLWNIFCFSKYEYYPLDPFKDEAIIIYNKLVPGGKFFFTYNNCELKPGLEFCGGFRAYQTESLVKGMLYGLGFDFVKNIEFNNGAHTIMVVKKPGSMASIKRSVPDISIVRKLNDE